MLNIASIRRVNGYETDDSIVDGVGVGGCGGDSDNPTGPQGQKLAIKPQ